jgi:hypothetical protein
MCPLLAQLKIGFFAAAVYSTYEANKAGLKQSIFLDVYGYKSNINVCITIFNSTQNPFFSGDSNLPALLI